MSLLYKVFTLGLSAIQINIPGIVKSSISCHAIFIACNNIFHLFSLSQIISLKFQTPTTITATFFKGYIQCVFKMYGANKSTKRRCH